MPNDPIPLIIVLAAVLLSALAFMLMRATAARMKSDALKRGRGR